jgi:hypothetical protein
VFSPRFRELAARQLSQLAHQRRRQRARIQRLERFARWDLRGATQARDLALLASFSLHLQYFHNQQQRVAMASVLQPRA